MSFDRQIKALQAEIHALQQQQQQRIEALQARTARAQRQTHAATARQVAQEDATFGGSMGGTAKRRGARGKGNGHDGSHIRHHAIPCREIGRAHV